MSSSPATRCDGSVTRARPARRGRWHATALAERALDTIERNTRLQAQLIEDVFDVHQVVANLVANALKFTDPGGSIDVRVEPAGRDVTKGTECQKMGTEGATRPASNTGLAGVFAYLDRAPGWYPAC